MSWAIVAAVGGGLLGAGGSIAGGVLSKPDEPKPVTPMSFNPASDPLVALNTLDLLASQGLFAPESVLSQAGPLQQAIQAYRAQTPIGGRRRDISRFNIGINEFLRGLDTPASAAIARAAGFASVAEAHAAQREFEAALAPRLEELREIATLSGSRQIDVERALRRMAAEPLDLGALRDAELTRINRELGQREQSALRAASVGGFNPGRSLEAIENLRSDADLDALTRAVVLLSGQGQSIANLRALNPADRAQAFAPGVGQFRVPTITGGTQFAPQTVDPFGASVSQAANQVGGTISSLGLLQLLNQQQAKPAAP